MTILLSAVFLFIANFLLVSAGKDGDPLISASTIDLKRIRRPTDDLESSNSAPRARRYGSDYGREVLDTFDSIPKQSVLQSNSPASANGLFDETKKSTPKKSGHSTSKSSNSYGYPYMLAPTLPPFLKHISDRREDESESIASPRPKLPAMPRMPPMPDLSEEDDSSDLSLPKSTDSLKKRQGSDYDDSDSSDSPDFRPVSYHYSSYKEPSYRNFFDLDEFSPRRMYLESSGPYSRPAYSFPSPKPIPKVSPRDPYLSPSDEPTDGFYPKVKNNGVSTSFSSYDKRNKYYKSVAEPVMPHSRGYDVSDDFSNFSSEEDDYRLGEGGYVKTPKYEKEPSPYSEPDPYSGPPPPPPPPSKGSPETGGEGYESIYNSPIVGITRKRLLEYAGATDLFSGEPDYMKSAAIRKTKFGSIQDDYSPYRRSDVYSLLDYHFDESKRRSSRAKREVSDNEEAVPRCARNATLPVCLTDADYPTDEVKKIVSKNTKFLSQIKNTRLEINHKKPLNNAPTSFEDLEKIPGVCSSKKGRVYPKRAKDTEGIWRTIVNVDGAQQSIQVDVCRSAEAPCDYIPSAIPTKCVQKLASVTLITFNDKDNILEDHDFPVPTACACSVGRPTRIHSV